jgi:hypothetical protein
MLYIAADSVLANFAVESLKQLNKSAKPTATRRDVATVVVAAQFAIDAPGGQTIPRYIFDRRSGGSIKDSKVDPLEAPDNMTEQEALKALLNWVYTEPRCKADHYALILWGHGPELLFQPPAANPACSSNSLYLTPEQLRGALTDCKPPTGRRLDIVGFDACSMSMFEMAYEIKDQADYMVASQEEVPDLSFPYDSLIELFRKHGNDAVSLIELGVKAFIDAYQDYIFNHSTGTNPVTLSALRLDKCGALKNALGALACALWKAKNDGGLPDLLIRARQESRDYAGGLYVDLAEFSTKLVGQLNGSLSGIKKEIRDACIKVQDALKLSSGGTSKGLILVNSSSDTRSHGISIYLPYLTDDQYAQVQRPLVKGGTGSHSGKGVSDVLNGAASGYLTGARRDLVIVTEGYYSDLQLACDTNWYAFIAEVWSEILIREAPAELDMRYSAQQSAVNASGKTTFDSKLCKP